MAQEATTDLRVGTEFAGYRIEELIGRGSMSVVYRAEDCALGRKVALKLIGDELSMDKDFQERFLRESALAATLDHSNIIPVYEFGEADGHLYVATCHVEGTDLASLLAREGCLQPERTLAIVTQIAEALDAARWSRGLVHGSLGPREIRVAPPTDTASGERVLLGGFGLRQALPVGASLAETAQRRRSAIDYLAPEQIEGNSPSPRSDVYALGCILVECLSGKPPFRAGSPHTLLEAHRHEQPSSIRRDRPDLPAEIDRVIPRALAKWPEERYATAGELAAAAEAALVTGREWFGRASEDESSAPLALPLRRAPVAPREPQPSPGVGEEPSVAPDPAEKRVWAWKKPLTGIGLILIFAALVAGAVWLTNGESDAASAEISAADVAETPSAVAAETPSAVTVDEGEVTAQPLPAAEAAVVSRLGSLVRIDGETGEILARVPIESPTLLASDGRSVWVLSNGPRIGSELVRIDAATNAVAETFEGGLRRVRWLAAAGGSAWLGSRSRSVHRFASGASAAEPVSFAGLGGASLNFVPCSLVASADSLWVSGIHNVRGCSPALNFYRVDPETGEAIAEFSDLYRVDPATGEAIAEIDGANEVVAVGRGFLWALGRDQPVRNRADTPIVRIDTDTHEAVPVGVLGSLWADLAVADGDVWASVPTEHAIVRLDPMTGEEKELIDLGRAPWTLATGAGAVWAAMRQDGTVDRYDIAAGRVETLDVGGTPGDVVFAGGSLWLAVEELTVAQYTARAVSICESAESGLREEFERLEAAGVDLTSPLPNDSKTINEALARWAKEALVELRAIPPPEAVRVEFERDYSLLERDIEALRRWAEGQDAPAGWTPAAHSIQQSLQGCTAGG